MDLVSHRGAKTLKGMDQFSHQRPPKASYGADS